MANSGTVTAGSAALASQYNNLRDDVLNVSTGHTHTGASENGKKVHGTALDSTGASNGQVLTANGSGGVSFAAAGGAGQLSTLTGSAAYSTAASGVFTQLQISDTTNTQPFLTLTGGGTVIISMVDTAEDTNTHAIQSYYLGSTVIQGSSAVAQTLAGTTDYDFPIGYGFGSGTAFVIREAIKTTSPSQAYYLRKFNQTLGSNMWNVTLISAFSSTTNHNGRGPFACYQQGNDGAKYEASIGVWIGGDDRVGSMGTSDASLRNASVWLVNDASGSVYSAPFGSANAGLTANDRAVIRSIVYVPGIGTALGTVHAFGAVDNQPRWCQYAVGSASISAVSTATGSNAFIASKIDPTAIRHSFYAASATAVALSTVSDNNSTVWLDRTLGTVLAVAPFAPDTSPIRYTSNGNDGYLDFKTGWAAQPRDRYVAFFGTNANATFATYGTTFFAASGVVTMLAGAGSATHIVWGHSAGTLTVSPIAGIAQVAIGSASTGRMITFRDSVMPINVSASSGYWIGNATNNASQGVSYNSNGLRVAPALPTLVLPAGATATVTYRSRQYNVNNATFTSVNTDNPSALSTAVTRGVGTATWMTAGGTATLFADVITLA